MQQICHGLMNKRTDQLKSSAWIGFTLLEILVAIFIFAIIVTTIFGSFHTVFSNTEAIAYESALYEMGRNCLNRMVYDLTNTHISLPPVYTAPNSDEPPDPYRMIGERIDVGDTEFSRLRFTANAHVSFAVPTRDGIAEIVYYVKSDDTEGFILRRADSLYPYPVFEEKNSDPVLCRNVKQLKFLFYDQNETEFEQWDSEAESSGQATPVAVKIELVIGNDDINHRFETMVKLPVVRERLAQRTP